VPNLPPKKKRAARTASPTETKLSDWDEAAQAQFAAREAHENRLRDANDPDTFVVIVGGSREQRDAFLRALGHTPGVPDPMTCHFVRMDRAAAKLGISLPAAPPPVANKIRERARDLT
jgi:hypothetical protein